MGFLSKLGNVAQDFTSAALPFAMTVGANALIPGGGGIASALGGTKLLAALGAGAKGFAGNEQQERLRKMQKEQNRNNAMANLINTLSPRANYQPNQAKTPKAGMLETVATGAGQGIDAFQMAQAAQRQMDQYNRDKTIGDAKISAIRGADDAEFDRLSAVTTEGTPRTDAIQMPETTVTAKAPDEELPLGYLSGAASQRRANRAQDIQEGGNQAAIRASQAKFRQEQMEHLRLARMVQTNPAVAESPGFDVTGAMLGLSQLGDEQTISSIAGRQMSPAQQGQLASAQNTEELFAELVSLYRDVGGFVNGESGEIVGGDDLGPISARMNMPGGDHARKIGRINKILAEIGPALFKSEQSGVMSEGDAQRVIDRLPNPTAYDQVTEFSNLLDAVNLTRERNRRFLDNLRSVGTKVGKFGATGEDGGIEQQLLETNRMILEIMERQNGNTR